MRSGPALRPAPAAAPGVPAGAAAALAPPFRLPGEHFAAALGFLGLGAAGLVWQAPALAAGGFTSPRLVAVTHLFTLGWITTSIIGALYQLLPVTLGAAVRGRGLAHLVFGTHVSGVVVLVAGLTLGAPLATLAGGIAVGVALAVFAGILALTLRAAPRLGITGWSLAGAAAFLLVTVLLGLMLATNLRTGLLGPGRMLVLAVHLHVAAGGWVLLAIIGVAHRLLPMFLLSHGAPAWPGRAAAVCVAGGAGVLVLAHHLIRGIGLLAGYGLLAVGAAAFLWQAALWFRSRRRPSLDPGLRLVAAALAFLGLAVGLGLTLLWRLEPLDARLATAYGVALVVGGLGLFVAGHYYKIVPFLTWYHRFGPVAAEREVPTVAGLVAPLPAAAAAALLVSGAAGLVAGALAGEPGLARAAALVLAGGAGVEIAQVTAVARRRP